MSKYNINLDLQTQNSLSIIIDRIKPNSTILEFGPANGRLTKYLKEQLFCKVYSVEIDKEAAKDAKRYSEEIIVDDIENYSWLEKFNTIEFDYIIFADVLEHLYNPLLVLKKAKSLLKDSGSILISLPNIAHNSIIMELLDNCFNYQSTGLLDNTHIRFFTKKTIDKLIADSNLQISYESAVYKSPPQTEFRKNYTDIANSIATNLYYHKYGEVYQFIIEAKKRVDKVQYQLEKKEEALLFIDSGNSFNSKEVYKSFYSLESSYIIFEQLNIDKYIYAIRIDPLEYAFKIKLKSIFVNDTEFDITKIEHNGVLSSSGDLYFLHHDPQIILNFNQKTLVKRVVVEFDYISNILDIPKLSMELKEQQLQEYKKLLKTQELQIKELDIENQTLQKRLNLAYNSKRWKLFYPLDKLKELNISQKIYILLKSNRFLREIYYKLPIKHKYKWKIREFVSTGKISSNKYIIPKEDNLYLIKTNNHKKDLPLVSIIIPCFNQGCYLWESVASAYASYSGNLDVIIIDDGSTDSKTKKCLREIKYFYPDLNIIKKENGGLSSARNRGLLEAKGEYIQFLDADDLLAPAKIDMQIEDLQNKDDNIISICNYFTSDEDCKTFFKTEETIKGFDLKIDDFLYFWERGLSIPIHCGLFPKRAFKDIEFDKELKAKEDWLIWITLLLKKDLKLSYIDTHAAIYRVHTESMVRKSFVKMAKQWEIAYKKVSTLLEIDEREKFIQESQKWLNNYYQSNPRYKDELKNRIIEQTSKNCEFNLTKDDELRKIEILKSSLKQLPNFKPTISIIIPVFNHYDYLFEAIISITKQGSVPIELICIDDNSSDSRVKSLLKSISSINKQVTVILNNNNRGISYRQNEAVNIAKGEYIAFLDCDDYLKDNALEEVYRYILKYPQIDYFFSDRTNIDKDGKILYDACYKTVRASKNIKDDLLDRMIASHLKVIKKEAYQKAGGSDEKFSGIQDWDLALKIADFGKFYYIPKTLYCHRLHNNSVTSSDNVAQYKKSNILRRKYLNRWLLKSDEKKELDRKNYQFYLNLVQNSKTSEDVVIFSPKNLNIDSWYAPLELKEAYSKNKISIMDARGILDKKYIEFLRDFNSYFDLILCDKISISSQIIGSLWSEQIIQIPIEMKH